MGYAKFGSADMQAQDAGLIDGLSGVRGIGPPGSEGAAPTLRHNAAIPEVLASFVSEGYVVVSLSQVTVMTPFGERVYDAVVRNPTTGELIGVEVKTTLSDAVRLKPEQVAKDVSVMTSGAYSSKLGEIITGVAYATASACHCGSADVRPEALVSALRALGVSFSHTVIK